MTRAAAPPSGKRLELELELNGGPTPVYVYADGRVVAEETGKGDPVYESWSQLWSDDDLEDEAVYEDVLDQIDDDVRGEAEEKEGVDRGGDPDEYLKAWCEAREGRGVEVGLPTSTLGRRGDLRAHQRVGPSVPVIR